MVSLTAILAPMLFFISLGLGVTLSPTDFSTTLKQKPLAILVGWLSQFGLMPLIAFSFAHVFDVSNDVAIGMVLVGSAPGGTTSNLFTYWSHGDVALSISMSVASTLCAMAMLPLLIIIYIESSFTDDAIKVDYLQIAGSLLIVLVPCSAGLLIRARNTTGKWRGRFYWQWCETAGSIVGGLFLIVAVVWGAIANDQIFTDQGWRVWIPGLLMEPIGCLFGYGVVAGGLSGGCFQGRLTLRDARTIAIETGVQNSSLIIAIVGITYDDNHALRDRILVFPLVYSFCYIIHSAWITVFLRKIASQDDAHKGTDSGIDVAPSQPPLPTTPQPLYAPAVQREDEADSDFETEL